MGLDISIKKNDNEIFYSRSDYNLWGWLADFVTMTNDTGEFPITKENLEDLVITCESCLRNPSLVSKLMVSPSDWRKGYDGDESFWSIKQWLIPLRRRIKNILKEWDDNANYVVYISY